MNEEELLATLHRESPCSIPLTQHVTKFEMEKLESVSRVALKFKSNILAIIEEPYFYPNRKEEICARVFGI
jgi:NACalpha-BTF3-like transcription factor